MWSFQVFPPMDVDAIQAGGFRSHVHFAVTGSPWWRRVRLEDKLFGRDFNKSDDNKV